jgi:hypothetical protein
MRVCGRRLARLTKTELHKDGEERARNGGPSVESTIGGWGEVVVRLAFGLAALAIIHDGGRRRRRRDAVASLVVGRCGHFLVFWWWVSTSPDGVPTLTQE